MRTLFRTALQVVALLTALAVPAVGQSPRVIVEPKPVVEPKPIVTSQPAVVVNGYWPVKATVRIWSYCYPSVAIAAPYYYDPYPYPVSTCRRVYRVRYTTCGCGGWWPAYAWAGYYWPACYWPTYYIWPVYWPTAPSTYYPSWFTTEDAPVMPKRTPQEVGPERTAASLYSEALSFFWDRDAATAAKLLSAAVERESRDARLWYFKALAERAAGKANEAAESARRSNYSIQTPGRNSAWPWNGSRATIASSCERR